jgi:hypothetical protein
MLCGVCFVLGLGLRVAQKVAYLATKQQFTWKRFVSFFFGGGGGGRGVDWLDNWGISLIAKRIAQSYFNKPNYCVEFLSND